MPKKKIARGTDVHSKRDAARKRHARYRWIQFGKKVVTTAVGGSAVAFTVLTISAPADGAFDASKHHDRWPLKTGAVVAEASGTPADVPIEALAQLSNFQPVNGYDGRDLEAPVTAVDPESHKQWSLHEGQMISTEGYVHLVAFEEGDGDYDIQMNSNATNDPADLNECLVVEIPHPQATRDAKLSQQFAAAREYIRETCFAGQAPSGTVKEPVRLKGNWDPVLRSVPCT